MAGYLGSKAVLLSTTAATVTGNATVGGSLTAGSATISGDLTVDTDTLYVDSTNNRVGVGTTSPDSPLEVVATNDAMKISGSGVSSTGIVFETNGVERKQIGIPSGDNALAFYSDAGTTEAFRLDSTGNLLVGQSSTNNPAGANVVGHSLTSTGFISVTRQDNFSGNFNRKGSDGTIVQFNKDGTTVGSIGTQSGALTIDGAQSTSDAGIRFAGANWIPRNAGSDVDNGVDLGASSLRFDDLYATNGTIQTSDANEKQDIAELDEAEKRVAVACKGLIRKYRWKDAVAEKGDAARIHVGIIAQDLQNAFAGEGLDAHDYAMFISATWWEHDGQTYETAEEAPEGAVEKTRLGVRYPELLAFIIGAM